MDGGPHLAAVFASIRSHRFTLVDSVVKARGSEYVAPSVAVMLYALYPQPRTSGLLWRVPYDNQSRAAGPVGIGHTPQQIASQYKDIATVTDNKKAPRRALLPIKYPSSPSIYCSDSYNINSKYSAQSLHQARRIPAPTAHLLHVGVELVDQRGNGQARAVAFSFI